MALGPRHPRDAHTPACPCGHGDVPAELAGQRPLLERAATGDRQAFALLYDTQVDGVYRYLLAWTGDPGTAAGLTTQVFHSAIGWLPTTPGPEGEAGAWLTAMSRDALAQRGGGPGSLEPAGDVVAAVGRLREPEREVAILRLLLGHSLDHTAHLSGYSRRAAMELQLAACLTLHERTGGTPDGEPTGRTRVAGAVADGDPPEAVAASPPPGTGPVRSAEEFERRLGLREVDLTGSHPVLAEALAVASSLRRAAPGLVAAPPGDFVQRLRNELLTGTPTAAAASPAGIGTGPAGIGTGAAGIGTGAATRGPVDSREHHPLGSATFPHRGPRQPEVADPAARGASLPPRVAGSGRGSRGGRGVGAWLDRRPWLATAVATAGTVVVLALQAFGGSGQPTACAGPDCPTATSRAAADGGSRVGTPPTTVVESSTTSSTVAGGVVVAPSSSAPRTSAATVPPSTRPATTAPPTTALPRPTTTTAPTTTAPPTTAAPTTTTVAPAPT